MTAPGAAASITPPPPPPPAMRPRDTRLGLTASIACITVVAMAGTLSYPLIALLLERAGESGARIGVNTAMASLGILAFGLYGARPLAAVGLIPFLLLCIATLVASLAVFPMTDNYYVWCAARFVLGGATAGLYLGSEYWLLSDAPPAHRGRVVALYAFMLSAGYALGPSLLLVVGVEGWAPFGAAMALAALAAAPVALARRAAPPVEQRKAAPSLRYFRTDPSLLWAVVLFGAVEFGAMALAPVWAVRLGLEEETGVAFAVAIALGGLAFQPALGWAADRFPPRPILILAAGTCLAVALALPTLGAAVTPILAVMALWGGMAAALYTVSLTALGARYDGADLAAANAAIVFAYGLGAFIGPPLVGGAIDAVGPDGLPVAVGVLATLYLGLVIARIAARPRPRARAER